MDQANPNTTEADAAAAAAAADAAKKSPKQVKARVLMACAHGKPDDVVLVDSAVAKAGEEAGELDSNKAAVAYAESLAKA